MGQTQTGSAFGGSSLYGRSSEMGQDENQSQRSSMGAMQGQRQGMGGSQLEDLSMMSDFAGRRLQSGLVR